MPRNTHLSLAFAHVGRGQARIIVEVEARYLPPQYLSKKLHSPLSSIRR
jgi:hypothetical protein